MGQIKTYAYDTNGLGALMNQAKDIFLEEMARQKIITKDQARRLEEEWMITCFQKGWLGSTFDKLTFKSEDKDPAPVIKIVKILDRAKPEYESLLETEELLMQLIKDKPKNEALTHPDARIRALASKLYFDK